MPRRPEDVTSTKVNDETKQLIVDLLALVRTRFSSVRDMIRFALTQSDRPVWAVGSPANERHLNAAASAVSKFLGRAAERAPEWSSIVWIVRTCTPSDTHDQVLARMAGRWCAATGVSWPPGYVGPVLRGDAAVERLTDPDHAPDDTTRAELYHQQLRQAHNRIDELLRDKRELHRQVQALTTTAARARQRISDLETTVRDKDTELGQRVLANRRRWENLLVQLQHDHAAHTRQIDNRLHQVCHHLAVLVAHLYSRSSSNSSNQDNHGDNTSHARRITGRDTSRDSLITQPEDLLPIPGLGIDTELRDLLDPPTPPATPAAGWLVVYLRALVLLHHGVGFRSAFPPAIAEDLTTVITTSVLPQREILDALVDAYPMARAYAAPLHRAAHAERIGRPAPLTPVDTRTPTERRLHDADTVQLPGHPVRHPEPHPFLTFPPPPARPPRRRAPAPPVYAAEQITVAELIARYNEEHADQHGNPPPRPARRRTRHRATPPLIGDSG